MYFATVTNPPKMAMIPESGTRMEESGTPWLAACWIICSLKCLKPEMIKIAEKRILPIKAKYFIVNSFKE